MKNHLLILVGLALTASAQAQQAFVFSTQLATNVQNIPAKGIIAAHTITSIAQIANVAIIDNGTLRNFDQSAIRIISIVTNLVNQTQAPKPLLSAQRPPPVLPKQNIPGPQSLDKTKPAVKIPAAVPTNGPLHRTWMNREKVK